MSTFLSLLRQLGIGGLSEAIMDVVDQLQRKEFSFPASARNIYMISTGISLTIFLFNPIHPLPNNSPSP